MTTPSSTARSDSPAASAAQRAWHHGLRRYRASSVWPAVVQLGTTLLPLAALFWLMYRSLELSYWLTLALALPTAGFLVRTFIILHDCAHGSFTPSRRANEAIGFVTGVLTLTPFAYWRRDHAIHHAGSGDLARRGRGDIFTLTTEEYLARSEWGRLKYRMYRHPFVQLVIGPVYVLVIRWWQLLQSAVGYKTGTQPQAIDAAILAGALGAVALLSLTVGPAALALVYVPVFLLAAAVGIWLSHVQHQFEDTYWEEHADWDYTAAALRGSSHYRLPRVLEWMTGSIGLHHVHHMDPKIPNYRLRRCHEENVELHGAPEVTLRGSLRTMSLKLWDAERGRLVGFDAVERESKGSKGSEVTR